MTTQEITTAISRIQGRWQEQYDNAKSFHCNESLALNMAAEKIGHEAMTLLLNIKSFIEQHEDDLK